MSDLSRLKWTRGLVAFSIPVVIGIGVVLLTIIGANGMMG